MPGKHWRLQFSENSLEWRRQRGKRAEEEGPQVAMGEECLISWTGQEN